MFLSTLIYLLFCFVITKFGDKLTGRVYALTMCGECNARAKYTHTYKYKNNVCKLFIIVKCRCQRSTITIIMLNTVHTLAIAIEFVYTFVYCICKVLSIYLTILRNISQYYQSTIDIFLVNINSRFTYFLLYSCFTVVNFLSVCVCVCNCISLSAF